MKPIHFWTLFGAAAFALSGCGNQSAKAPPPPAVAASGGSSAASGQGDGSGVPVALGSVQYAAIPVTVSAYGTMKGGDNSQAFLSFMESGQLAQINGSIGQTVRKGQLLARLDTQPFQAQIAQAKADLQSAQASYSKAQLGARPQQQAQTKVQIAESQVQVQIAQAQLQREQKLLALGIAAQSEVDAARGSLAAAQAQEEVAREQYSLQAHPLAQDVAVARAGVAQARAALLAARQSLVFAHLYAPFSGIITARLHNEGESVAAAVPVLEIANASAPVFTASFAPQDAARIGIGDASAIHFDGAGRYSGHVAAIDPEHAHGSHLVPVLIRLSGLPPQTANTLGPGAYGQASVQVATGYGLLVPSSAVVDNPTTGSSLVFRHTRGHNIPVSVTVLRNVGSRTQIASTELHSGDTVVKQGAYELSTQPSLPAAGGDD